MTTKNKQITLYAPLDDTGVKKYIAEVNAIPRIDKDEERQLVLLKDSEDENIRKDAAQKLILANLWYVIYEAKSFSGYRVSAADLIQEGNLGLMKAINKFSLEYNVRITSYAKMRVRAAMTEYVINNSKCIKLATTKPQRKLFFNLNKNKHHLGAFTDQEVNDLSEKLKVKPFEIREMEQRLGSNYLPYDNHLTIDASSDERYLVPHDYIESKTLEPFSQLLKDDSDVYINNTLRDGLESLSERDRDIIKSRWLEDKKHTLHELSDKYGVSAERIRQLEKNAIDKIRGMCN